MMATAAMTALSRIANAVLKMAPVTTACKTENQQNRTENTTMNQALEIAPEATESQTQHDTRASQAFVLHCGGDVRSSSYIRNLPTPEPKGPQHVPVPYGLFASETAGALRRHGYTIKSQAHATSHEDQRYFGVFEANIERELACAYDPFSLVNVVRPVRLDPTGEPFEARLRSYVCKDDATGLERWNAIYGETGTSIIVFHDPADLAVPQGVQDSISHLVGLRASHDQSFSLQLVLGKHVFVCDNLAFSGQILIRRKNTVNAAKELGALLDKAVDVTTDQQRVVEKRIEAYRATPCSGDQARSAIVRTMEAGSIGGSKWKDVLHQFEEPNHVEHLDGQGNPTVDTLENAFTEVFKNYHYSSVPERSRKLCPVLDGLADFHPVVGNVIDLD